RAFPEQGIYVKAPVALVARSGTYSRSELVPAPVPITTLSGEADNVLYQVTVIDFVTSPAESTDLLAEMEWGLTMETDVAKTLLIEQLQLGGGAKKHYGWEMTSDLKNGGRRVSLLFFKEHKLYVVEATIRSGDSDIFFNADRFIHSVHFD